MNTCIYKITCLVNGKIYIGSAKNFSVRTRLHLDHLRRGVHKNKHLQNAFNSYGEKQFLFEIIEPVIDLSTLLAREQYWLDETKCYDRTVGFNICIKAESSLGIKRNDAFKEKIRQHNLNRPEEVKRKTIDAVKRANTGRTPHNKGVKMWANKPHPRGTLGMKFPDRKLSPEHYKKICEANRKPRGKEYLEKRSSLSSKTYYFISPEGAELKIENLLEFCKAVGLNTSHMYQVAKGKKPQHKGWIRDEAWYEEPPDLNRIDATYNIVHS